VTAISLLLAAIGLLLLLPTVSDAVSLLVALVARRRASPAESPDRVPRFLILTPAHNEELLIAATVESVKRLDWPDHAVDVVVVADNCTDRTAEIAAGAGATVLERSDSVLKGKPRAIAWALERVDLQRYDAVVVLDADSMIDPGYCAAIAAQGRIRDRAFQGWIDLSNRDETALTRMAYVFSAARCLYMNRLKTAAGLAVPFGNGLCIGVEVLERYGWTAFSLSEDWELYAILVERGVPVVGVPGAHTYSQEAKSFDQGASQRSRWANGKLAVLLQYAGGLLRTRHAGWRQKLDVFAELIGFGPVVHFGLSFVLVLLAMVLQLPGWPWIVGILVASVARLGVYTLLALRHDPEPMKTLLAFGYVPVYGVWRVGVQLKSFATFRNQAWVRTGRHAEDRSSKAE